MLMAIDLRKKCITSVYAMENDSPLSVKPTPEQRQELIDLSKRWRMPKNWIMRAALSIYLKLCRDAGHLIVPTADGAFEIPKRNPQKPRQEDAA